MENIKLKGKTTTKWTKNHGNQSPRGVNFCTSRKGDAPLFFDRETMIIFLQESEGKHRYDFPTQNIDPCLHPASLPLSGPLQERHGSTNTTQRMRR